MHPRDMAVDIASLEAPVAPAKSIFISSPGKDFFFFFASVSVVAIAWFAATVMHVSGFTILATVAVVANGPHLVSTWTRVYFDKREWKARPGLIVGMPLVIATTVVMLTLFLTHPIPVTVLGRTFSLPTSGQILNSTILYWATWHFVAQNWGLLRIYQRKSGEPLSSVAMRIERPILFLFVLWCLLHRLDTGPRVLFGIEVLHFDIPSAVVNGLWGPLAFLIGFYAWQRIKERNAPWAKASLLRTGFILCAFAGFFIPFECIKTDDTSAFAAAACWHGIQYLGIVRQYHVNAWKGGVSPDNTIVSWLSQPGKGRLALYAALLMALAGSGYVIIYGGSLLTRGTGWNVYTWGAVVWISLTLSHYWLDGVIWKLSKPEVARRVGITT